VIYGVVNRKNPIPKTVLNFNEAMNKAQDHLEVEVKFHLTRPEVLRRRLTDLDATARPRIFERNLRFEDSNHTLRAGQKLLRLRQDDACRLTFKSKPSSMVTQCKVYRELEVAVGDFDAMQAILNALGFMAVQTYEKWRQEFEWKGVTLCVDTLPFGHFLEIEGEQAQIKHAAAHLALPWEKRILANYLAIFERVRARYNLPFDDVTFSNFEPYPIDMTPLLGELEAG
jgi:adenylate cyclase class 2